MLKDAIERINDGSATIKDYEVFFGAFGVNIINSDGTYRTLYEIFEDAHNNYNNAMKGFKKEK